METRIDKDELEDLRDSAMFLDALKHHNVRKWKGYNDAVDTYHAWKRESNDEERSNP